MDKEKKKKLKAPLWMQLLISIIGTAIGVGLTFAVSNWMDNRKKEDEKESLTYCQKWIKEDGARRAKCVRLDASRDKMELKKDENVVYYKREK